MKEALLENDFCVEEEVLPKNDLEEERNREDDDKDDDEEETEEEEEHVVVVVGFIIIIAFTRRHTKCCMCTCLVLCGNSDVRIYSKTCPMLERLRTNFPCSVMVLKMQDEQREECSCS